MKLHCSHCNTQLTTDLYPTSKWHIERWGDDDDPRYEYSITPGSFINNHIAHRMMVNPDNVTIPIPEYESGMGCCNISHTPLHCPICGLELAICNIDCWQDKSIDFNIIRCNRVYSAPSYKKIQNNLTILE